MSLKGGAETVVNQCLKVEKGEDVLVLNDGNDRDIIDALLQVLEDSGFSHRLIEYPEPEEQGMEPPEEVAKAMREADVVIAPTNKSLSHTEARRNACEGGTRVATLPGITKETWNSSLQADYDEVSRITRKVYSMLEDTEKVRVETPSGTDLEFSVEFDTYIISDGILNQSGDFGNIPSGESHGYPREISGTLVIDHFPFSPDVHRVEIREGEVVAIENYGKHSELERKFDEMECARKIAEFGFGTNPEATLIGNVLQDEKVLGTVHFAFGDNTSYLPESRGEYNPCDIHWDAICENPTVWFDDDKVLDGGEPMFMDKDLK